MFFLYPNIQHIYTEIMKINISHSNGSYGEIDLREKFESRPEQTTFEFFYSHCQNPRFLEFMDSYHEKGDNDGYWFTCVMGQHKIPVSFIEKILHNPAIDRMDKKGFIDNLLFEFLGVVRKFPKAIRSREEFKEYAAKKAADLIAIINLCERREVLSIEEFREEINRVNRKAALKAHILAQERMPILPMDLAVIIAEFLKSLGTTNPKAIRTEVVTIDAKRTKANEHRRAAISLQSLFRSHRKKWHEKHVFNNLKSQILGQSSDQEANLVRRELQLARDARTVKPS